MGRVLFVFFVCLQSMSQPLSSVVWFNPQGEQLE